MKKMVVFINYDSLRKFHISVGLNLIIWGVILVTTNFLLILDKTSAIISSNELTSEVGGINLNALFIYYNVIYDIAMIMLIVGFIAFAWGYLPWVRESLKEWSDRRIKNKAR